MRVLILTARPTLAANRRLVEAAATLELEAQVVDATACTAILQAGGHRTGGIDGVQSGTDVVLPRIGNWRPESLLAVLESLVDRGVRTPNPPAAMRCGRDHWQTLRTLAAAGLEVPDAVVGSDPEVLAGAAVAELGLPVVVKLRRSRMGIGVILCRTRDHLESVLDSLWRVGDEFIVQRWLSGGETSHRVLIAGGRLVAAARFQAADGEWRSNAARGGGAHSYEPDPSETAAATAAAEAIGLGQCGVDLVMTDTGPLVLEVNPTPGFLRLEQATGVDVARSLVADAAGRILDPVLPEAP